MPAPVPGLHRTAWSMTMACMTHCTARATSDHLLPPSSRTLVAVFNIAVIAVLAELGPKDGHEACMDGCSIIVVDE